MSVEQLPRGRHGLTRAEVSSSQRVRMLRAMAEAVAERGYAKTPVAEVLRRAGVSRETFYQHFANKEACFLDAYDYAAGVLMAEMGDALGIFADPSASERAHERVGPVIARYLEVMASEPALTRTFLVEVYAASPAAIMRRAEIQGRFVDAIATVLGAEDERQRFACEAVVMAASAMATNRVCAGRTQELGELSEPFQEFVRATFESVGL